MINLLPYSLKKQTNAARSNTVLVIYIIISIFAALFLAAACYTTYTIIKSSPEAVIVSGTTNRQGTDINDSKNILDQQISYSYALNSLSNILPKDSILSSIVTSDSASGKQITVKIHSKGENLSASLQTSIQGTQIFSNYTLLSNNQIDGKDGYNYELVFSALISKGLTQ